VAYSIPPYIVAAAVDSRELRFKWDDWRASQDFEYQPDEVLERLAKISLRAKITAAIGMYEWIMWRFRLVSNDPTPLQVAEAAWCANVRRDYMVYDEFDRDDWMGPVRGPLWCAMTWLMPMMFLGDDNLDEWESGISYLARLANHVLPNPAVFREWLDGSINRLLELYPAVAEDPFGNLFGENEEARRGPLVPREVLATDSEFRPDMTRSLIDRFLRTVDYRSNPFLNSPEAMLSNGFDGAPYAFNTHDDRKRRTED